MELNNYIDHTNLETTATLRDIEKLCDEAIKYHFTSVCIHPYYVSLAKELLADTNILVCTVVGFPLGMNTISGKAYEAIDAINNGADEIDMVVNMGAIKNKDFDYIKEEIEEIRDCIDGRVLKIIIETCYLTEAEIIKMTEICNETFVNFIKISNSKIDEAALKNIELINNHKNEVLEIKVSGEISNLNTIQKMIKLGATRIETSNSVKIMHEKEED